MGDEGELGKLGLQLGLKTSDNGRFRPKRNPNLMLKRLLVVAALLAVSVAPAGAFMVEPDFQPITPEAFVDDLRQAGFRNGNMPSTRMIEVEGCLLERSAAYTLSLLLESARADGVTIYPLDCYRSFSSQASAYDRRCPVETEEVKSVDPETGEETVVAVKKSRNCSGPPTAAPGHSNHGWGRAVDFGTGRRALACSDVAFKWLQANGARFGWVHPGWAHCGRPGQEPWHWEWGGVTEALPLPITPTFIPEEIEALIR